MISTFEVPKELADATYRLVESARESGKIRRGTNESTKSIERGEARLLVIAQDVNPPEIVAHLPFLCDEKSIPYTWVPKRAELGAAAGMHVGTATVAIVDSGEASKELRAIIEKVAGLKVKPKEVPKEKPKEEVKPKVEKPAEKEEKKPEEKVEEKITEEAKPATSEIKEKREKKKEAKPTKKK